MRRWMSAVLLIVLWACQREPSFDERYNRTAADIGNRARTMDAELNRTEANKAAERPVTGNGN